MISQVNRWIIMAIGLTLITLNLAYAIIRMRANDRMISRFEAYVAERDARWSTALKSFEEHLTAIEGRR